MHSGFKLRVLGLYYCLDCRASGFLPSYLARTEPALQGNFRGNITKELHRFRVLVQGLAQQSPTFMLLRALLWDFWFRRSHSDDPGEACGSRSDGETSTIGDETTTIRPCTNTQNHQLLLYRTGLEKVVRLCFYTRQCYINPEGEAYGRTKFKPSAAIPGSVYSGDLWNEFQSCLTLFRPCTKRVCKGSLEAIVTILLKWAQHCNCPPPQPASQK